MLTQTALFEIDIIEIERWRDGEEPLRGFKGCIAMIEFKTQQEIFPKDESADYRRRNQNYQRWRHSPRWELGAYALQLRCH